MKSCAATIFSLCCCPRSCILNRPFPCSCMRDIPRLRRCASIACRTASNGQRRSTSANAELSRLQRALARRPLRTMNGASRRPIRLSARSLLIPLSRIVLSWLSASTLAIATVSTTVGSNFEGELIATHYVAFKLGSRNAISRHNSTNVVLNEYSRLPSHPCRYRFRFRHSSHPPSRC